ncbi:DUF721 domain-containing protein [Bartonella sp. B10]
MGKQFQEQRFYHISEMVSEILDPVLRKRTGINVALIEYWSQIIGHDIGEYTIPLRIIWNRYANQYETFQPATLVVACEGRAALKLMHETSELLHRINVFFGYIAIDRIKIEQRCISVFTDHPPMKLVPSEKDKEYIGKMLEEIENDSLRHSLYKLGCCIFAEKNNK